MHEAGEDEPELTDDEIKAIAMKVLKNFTRVKVDWRKEFPDADLPPSPEPLDLFKHIMPLNPGKVYQSLEKGDANGETYGLIP